MFFINNLSSNQKLYQYFHRDHTQRVDDWNNYNQGFYEYSQCIRKSECSNSVFKEKTIFEPNF